MEGPTKRLHSAKMVIVLLLSVLGLALLQQGSPGQGTPIPGQDTSIPENVRGSALGYLESQYGAAGSLYAEGAVTKGEWSLAEPLNTSSLVIEGREDEVVYVFFLLGPFERAQPIRVGGFDEISPAGGEGQEDDASSGEDEDCVGPDGASCNSLHTIEVYSSARIVMDENGLPLLEQLYKAPPPATSDLLLIGSHYDY